MLLFGFYIYTVMMLSASVAGLSSYYIEKFGGDALLTQFIVFELQLFEKFASIVACRLHGHHPRGLLGGAVLGTLRVVTGMSGL